jgi:MarR family transcriptional regulator, 2-MHQ and catechol-resistance regulon repressor
MPTRHDGADEERRALNLFIALSRAGEWMQKGALSAAPLPESLTLSQFGVLEALYHLGPMCQADVGRKLLKTKGNVSVVIDRLVQHGLVERRSQAGDRRYVVVALTETGRSLIADYFPEIARGFAGSAAVLTAEEQQTLTELSKKLGRGIENQLKEGQK